MRQECATTNPNVSDQSNRNREVEVVLPRVPPPLATVDTLSRPGSVQVPWRDLSSHTFYCTDNNSLVILVSGRSSHEREADSPRWEGRRYGDYGKGRESQVSSTSMFDVQGIEI